MQKRPNQRAANVAYYAANREREIDRVVTRQRATTAFLRRLKEVPCADCGGSFHPVQMDFDHRDPKQKSFLVNSGHAALKNRAALVAEIEKCTSCAPTVITGEPKPSIACAVLNWSCRTPHGPRITVHVGATTPTSSIRFGRCHAPTAVAGSRPAQWSSITAVPRPR